MRKPARRPAARGLVVTGSIAGAVAAPLAIWLAAVAVAGHRLLVTVPRGGAVREVGLRPVVMFALLAGLAGWGALAALDRISRRARSIWLGLALTVLALSFVPLLGADTSLSTRLVLASMHVAVAAVLIPTVIRSRRAAA